MAVDQPVGAQVDPARVTLVEPGDSPQVLQYKDLGNDPQDATITVGQGFDQSTQENSEKIPELGNDLTSFTMPVSAETSEPTNSDSARSVVLTVGEAESSDLESMEDVDSVRGFRLGWFAAPNGQISSVNFAAPTKATDEGRALVESAYSSITANSVVFPTEAVGVGGSWTVDTRVSGAETLLQTTTYTITSIEGDVVTLDVELSQRPATGAVTYQQDGKDVTLQVLNSNTTSEGTLTVDLTKPLPTAGSLHYTTRVIYGEQGSAVQVIQDTTTKVEYS